MHRNAQQGKENALFEIGNVYREGTGGRVPGVEEAENLAVIIVGSSPTLADAAAALGEQLGIADFYLNPYPHPLAGPLKYRLPVTAFEVNLTELIRAAPGEVPASSTLAAIQSRRQTTHAFVPIARYPAVFRDLSVLVAPEVTPEHVQEIIERAGGELVADVDLFDIYSSADDSAAGDEVARQSLAFHITYQAATKTLTDDEVAAVHNRIVETLKTELDADLRES
jgi:phenylalanyl-tRNA synthetase beta subunit